MKPLEGCVFCKGIGWFWHLSGKKYECYCVSFATRPKAIETTALPQPHKGGI